MSVYHLKEIRRWSATTLKQLNNYYEQNFLVKKIDSNGKIIADDDDLITIFQIKSLKHMFFNLKQISIILEKADKTELLKLIEIYFQKEKKISDSSFLWIQDYIKYEKIDNELLKSSFPYLSENYICVYFMIDLFIMRHNFKDTGQWLEFQKLRKDIFRAFKNYNPKTFEKNNLDKYFENVDIFLKANVADYSKLHFIAFFGWIKTEPRYLKEFKLIAKFNLSKDLLNFAIEWIFDKK